MREAKPPIERILAKVAAGHGGCVVFIGGRNRHGYGHIVVGSRSDGSRRTVSVHRVVYEALVGPIPPGLDIDHACSNRSCIRPDHLQAVTHARNVELSAERGRMGSQATHCKRGHEFTPENTRIAGSRKQRLCRECYKLRESGYVRVR